MFRTASLFILMAISFIGGPAIASDVAPVSFSEEFETTTRRITEALNSGDSSDNMFAEQAWFLNSFRLGIKAEAIIEVEGIAKVSVVPGIEFKFKRKYMGNQ